MKENKDGYYVVFDDLGKAVRKEKYTKGWREGNPLKSKRADEIIDILGGDELCYFSEEPEGEEIIDNDKASLLLTGTKYE